MQEYEFNEVWKPYPLTGPLNATRCLVTDGDLILIATYITDEDKITWVFQGLNNSDKFNVIAWMPLPKPPKKLPDPISAIVEKIEKPSVKY